MYSLVDIFSLSIIVTINVKISREAWNNDDHSKNVLKILLPKNFEYILV